MSSIAAGVRLNKLFAEFEVLKAEVASLKTRVAALENPYAGANPFVAATPIPGIIPKRRGRPPKVKNGN